MSLFTFFEYDSVKEIKNDDLKNFINRKLKDLQNMYKQVIQQEIFDIDQDGYIRFKQFVGLITLYNKENKDYIYIEILPKIYKSNNSSIEEARGILLKMLESHLDVEFFKSLDYGKIDLKKQNMLEIYVILFIEYLKKLSLGLKRKYQVVESNINNLKGRLLFAKHINKNLFNPTRFYTRHEEFTLDIPENRILKTAIKKMYRVYKDILSTDVKRELKKYLVLFSDIPESSNIYADLLRSNIDRTFVHYKDAFKLAKLFLMQHTLTNAIGKDYDRKNEEEVGLIFDMNILFEKYVAKKLKEYRSECEKSEESSSERSNNQIEIDITEQEGKYYLLSKQSSNISSQQLFKIIPDIVIRRGNNIYILDTKWKEIDINNEYNYNIDQRDLYQMLSYASIYRNLSRIKNQKGRISLILIYPRTQKVNNETQKVNNELQFTFNDEHSTPIKIFLFDLNDNDNNSLKSLCRHIKQEIN